MITRKKTVNLVIFVFGLSLGLALWGGIFSCPAMAANADDVSVEQASSSSKKSPPKLPVLTEDEFKQIFRKYPVHGTFVLFDAANKTYLIFNKKRSEEPYSPASTFKIANSLIALETGAIKGADEIIPWDGVTRRFDQLNQDHCMKTAFKHSVVWFYQELARKIGEKQMKHWLDKMGYGNRDIADNIDDFWLKGELRISAKEQVEFLTKLHRYQLPIAKQNVDIVKEIMVVERTDDYVLRAKTGWTGEVGWYVGYVERNDNCYFFALNIDIFKRSQSRARIEIPMTILKRLKLL